MLNSTQTLSRFYEWFRSVNGFSWWTFAILCFAVGLGIFLRLQSLPLLEGRYFLGTDAYRFVRQSQQILRHGALPSHDEMRAVPLGKDNSYQLTFYPYALAYTFRLLKLLLPRLTLEKAAILYPVITFGFICFAFFLLVRHLTEVSTALFAVLGLTTVPDFIPRTMAGFADRDALTLLLFLLAILLYCQSWRVNTFFKKGLLVVLSGVITGLLGLTWIGVGVLTMIIVVLNAVYFLTNLFSARQVNIRSNPLPSHGTHKVTETVNR
ncbi:MAG: hypothetical protein O7E52_02785 [Candidatus Poribacteria bacterium]|nr:hypothetical protein [Candidatus Poribacteria bacterium]